MLDPHFLRNFARNLHLLWSEHITLGSGWSWSPLGTWLVHFVAVLPQALPRPEQLTTATVVLDDLDFFLWGLVFWSPVDTDNLWEPNLFCHI